MKSYMCLSKRITNKHKELPRSSHARAAWPVSSRVSCRLCVTSYSMGSLFKLWCLSKDEDAFVIRERNASSWKVK